MVAEQWRWVRLAVTHHEDHDHGHAGEQDQDEQRHRSERFPQHLNGLAELESPLLLLPRFALGLTNGLSACSRSSQTTIWSYLVGPLSSCIPRGIGSVETTGAFVCSRLRIPLGSSLETLAHILQARGSRDFARCPSFPLLLPLQAASRSPEKTLLSVRKVGKSSLPGSSFKRGHASWPRTLRRPSAPRSRPHRAPLPAGIACLCLVCALGADAQIGRLAEAVGAGTRARA